MSQLTWSIRSWPLKPPRNFSSGYPLISISSEVSPYHFAEGILHSYLTQSTCLSSSFPISSVHCHQIITLKQHIYSKVTVSGREKMTASLVSVLYSHLIWFWILPNFPLWASLYWVPLTHTENHRIPNYQSFNNSSHNHPVHSSLDSRPSPRVTVSTSMVLTVPHMLMTP